MNLYQNNPYQMDPMSFIQAALQNQSQAPQAYTPLPQSTPQQKSFGPMHEALQNYLSQQLMANNAVPGLLTAMQNDPSLAQQVGGLMGNTYSPQYVTPGRTSFTVTPTGNDSFNTTSGLDPEFTVTSAYQNGGQITPASYGQMNIPGVTSAYGLLSANPPVSSTAASK